MQERYDINKDLPEDRFPKIKRCKKCNTLLNFTSGDYGLVDYLCEKCWSEREKLNSSNRSVDVKLEGE